MSSAMARGLVVSRGSPGSDSLRLGSLLSSRVTIIAKRTRELREPRGPADRLQDQVRGGVVAPIDRRGAEIASVMAPSATCALVIGA